MACSLILLSCNPKVSTLIKKTYPTLNYKDEVRIFTLSDSVPKNAEELGIVKFEDTGFSTNCGWDVAIETIKIEARKVGGNSIKIISEKAPSYWGSSCHRVNAKILRIDNLENIPVTTNTDSSLINKDYSIIHFYRQNNSGGALVSYDVYLGDSAICKINNNCKKTLKIKKDGYNTIWASTEVKEVLPISIKLGHEYYIRCSVTMGALLGRPKLEIVDNKTGFEESKYIKEIIPDVITMIDGTTFECDITATDEDFIYFSFYNNGKNIDSQVDKKQVKSIQKNHK
jgi:hypothetical protein